MAWAKHVPTVYLVSWDGAGVVKIGTTDRQRWRKFVLRGARLVETWQFAHGGAYAFELAAHTEASAQWPYAFDTRDAATPLLGTHPAGWRECYRAPAKDALAMLQAMHPHHAQASEPSNAAEQCDRMEHGRTDGRTDVEAHARSRKNYSYVTRGRAYRLSLWKTP